MENPVNKENVIFVKGLQGRHDESLAFIAQEARPDNSDWEKYGTWVSMIAVSQLYQTLLSMLENATDQGMQEVAAGLVGTIRPFFEAALSEVEAIDIYDSRSLFLTIPDDFAAHLLDAIYLTLLLQSFGADVFKEEKNLSPDDLRNFKKRIRSLQGLFDQLIDRDWQPYVDPSCIQDVIARYQATPAKFAEILDLKVSDVHKAD